MRAFARDIGISPSRMSEIMSGKKGLSVLRAEKVAEHLQLNPLELKLFMTSVKAKHSRSHHLKQTAQNQFEEMRQLDGFHEVDLEKFKIISDCHHVGILEMFHLKDFSPKPEWIAKRIGIDEQEVRLALVRLLDFGLLRVDEYGNYQATEADFATPSDIPSSEIRKFHKQTLKKAEQSLEKNAVDERDFSSMTMAIQKDKMAEAKLMIRDFRRKFCQTVQSSADADRVYLMNIHFFPLDEIV